MNHRVQQLKQRLNRAAHASKAYHNAVKKANALKRQYHKAAFLVLYNRNQPHRNTLTQQEITAIRNMMQNARRMFMSNRVLGKTVLPPNIVRRLVNNGL
jgi:hypothetical protein